MPSLTRPQLVASLAQGIAAIGRLPFLGTLTYTGSASGHTARRSNSAQRLKALSGALTVSEELAGALRDSPGPVLLVDDYTDSGWTLAVAARLLRQSGGEQVLPLVLAAAG